MWPFKPKAASEAVFQSGVPLDPDENLWVPWSVREGLWKTKGLHPITQSQMIKYAHQFYKGNPLAKRMIEIPAEYLIGDGIAYDAISPEVKEVLDLHWTDTTNNWQILQFDRARDLGLTGELCIPAFVNPHNGFVTLGNIDTELIDVIVEDPENTMKPYAVILKRIRMEDKRRAYKIIDVANVDSSSPAFGRLVGLPTSKEEMDEFGVPFKVGDPVETRLLVTNVEAVWRGQCFFFGVNKPMTAQRGWSDLLADMDWIDAHDQYLFSQVEKAIESAKYVWDILLKGMNEQQQRAWLQKQPKYRPGIKLAHNENVEYSVKSPNLHLEDAGTFASVLKNHILSGTGLPPIWFAESMTSRASAPEQAEPAYKHIKIRQRYVAYMISQIFRYVIDQAIIHQRLRQDGRRGMKSRLNIENSAYGLRMPDVSAKDQRALAIAIRNMADSLKSAVEIGFLTRERATKIFERYLDMTGIDTWLEEPKGHLDIKGTVDPNYDIRSVLIKTESLTEFSKGGYTYYLYPDRRSGGLTW